MSDLGRITMRFMLPADAARPVHTKAGDVSTDMLSSASEQSDKLEAHARPDGYGDTSDSGTGSDQSDSSTASVQLPMPRRSLQLQFTCGKCGAKLYTRY